MLGVFKLEIQYKGYMNKYIYYNLILFKHPYWPRNSHMVFLKDTY